MKEDYKLIIKTKDLLGLLSKYYSERLGEKVTAKEEHAISRSGLYETKEAEVTLYYEKEANIIGFTAKSTHYIGEEELKEVLDELLKDYTITDLTLKKGITTDGDYRETYDVAYFEGIEISLKEKQATLTLK